MQWLMSIVLALLAAIPRAAQEIPAVASPDPGQVVRGGEPDLALPGAPPSLPPGGGVPQPTIGVASWYPADGLVGAAGPRLRVGAWRGRLVDVSAGGRTVRVRLTDWCQCYGSRVIDLSDDAFAALTVDAKHPRGDLGRGLLRVTVYGVPALPATDR